MSFTPLNLRIKLSHYVLGAFVIVLLYGLLNPVPLSPCVSPLNLTNTTTFANQLNTKYPNLDGKMIDNDGVIDNLMIIASVQSHGHFVAHATNAGNDTKLAGKGIGPYNLIETHQVIMDLIFIQRHMNTYIRSTGLLPSKLCI